MLWPGQCWGPPEKPDPSLPAGESSWLQGELRCQDFLSFSCEHQTLPSPCLRCSYKEQTLWNQRSHGPSPGSLAFSARPLQATCFSPLFLKVPVCEMGRGIFYTAPIPIFQAEGSAGNMAAIPTGLPASPERRGCLPGRGACQAGDGGAGPREMPQEEN